MLKPFMRRLLWLGCTLALLGLPHAAEAAVKSRKAPAPVAAPSAVPAAPAAPWMAAPERLAYDVGWGPLSLGTAWLTYAPGAKGAYSLEAHVKDSSMFITLDDTWRAEGAQGKDGWASKTYTAKQRENDYRADKLVTFSPGKAVYENFIGREPSQTIVLPPGTRDVLSTLYNLRAKGLGELQQPHTVPVMGLKRVGLLEMKPAVLTPGHLAGETPVWLLEMLFHNQDPRKPRTDRWTIWLADDGRLTPLKIEAKVKLGTFTAKLDK